MISPGDPTWRDDTATSGRWRGIEQASSATKVKRGLGLLLLGAVCYVVRLLIEQADASAPVMLLGAASALLAIGLGLVGLVLLAWGLLAD